VQSLSDRPSVRYRPCDNPVARANEPSPHRLDSRTRVQIVLACELVEPRGNRRV
jgi:hypothetical protein